MRVFVREAGLNVYSTSKKKRRKKRESFLPADHSVQRGPWLQTHTWWGLGRKYLVYKYMGNITTSSECFRRLSLIQQQLVRRTYWLSSFDTHRMPDEVKIWCVIKNLPIITNIWFDCNCLSLLTTVSQRCAYRNIKPLTPNISMRTPAMGLRDFWNNSRIFLNTFNLLSVKWWEHGTCLLMPL